MGPYSAPKRLGNWGTWGSQISNFLYVSDTDTLIGLCDQGGPVRQAETTSINPGISGSGLSSIRAPARRRWSMPPNGILWAKVRECSPDEGEEVAHDNGFFQIGTTRFISSMSHWQPAKASARCGATTSTQREG